MGLTRDDVKGGLVKGGRKPPPVRAPKPRKQTAPAPAFTPGSRVAQLRSKLSGERLATPKGPLPPGPKLNRFGGEIRAKKPEEFNQREKQVYLAYERAKALGKPTKFERIEMQQMGLIPHLAPDFHFDEHGRHLPSNSIATRFTDDFIHTTLGAPAVPFVLGKAAVRDVTHPQKVVKGDSELYRDVAKPIGESFKETVTDPTRHPLNSLLNVGAVLTAGASAVEAGAGAAAGAEAAAAEGAGAGGRLAGAVRGARAARGGAPIELKVKGEDGKITTVRVTRSNSALRRLVQRHRAAIANKELAKDTGAPDGYAAAVKASFGAPEKRVGKLLSRHNDLEQQMLESYSHGLDRFHRQIGRLPLNRHTLTDAEQKAIDVASTHGREIVGNPDAVKEAVSAHTVYHANAAKLAAKERAAVDAAQSDLEAAVAAGDESAARVAQRRLRRAQRDNTHGFPENHEAQASLSKLAGPHLLNPKPRLRQALEQVPRAIEVREQNVLPLTDRQGDARLTEEALHHRIGARHLELTYGAKGLETPLEELKRLRADQQELDRLRSGKSGAKVEQLTRLIERVQKVRAKRGGPAHEAELRALQAELDAYSAKFGPHIKVMGAKRVNDALQEAAPAERRFIGENPDQPVQEPAVLPHTLESAEGHVEKMQRTHEQVLGRYMLGPDYNPRTSLRDQVKLEPAELYEQKFRNTSNGLYTKTMKALNEGKRGPAGGSAALRRGFLPNIKDKKIAAAEREMIDMLTKRAEQGDEFAQKFLAHNERLLNMSNGIADVREHVAFGGEVTPELLAEKLGGRELPTSRAGKDMGATVEETRPRPTHSIGAVRKAEHGSARIDAKLDRFKALDAQEELLKKELNKLTGLGRKGAGSQKPGYRMMHLLLAEDGRHARVSEIHDEIQAAGRLLRDQGAFYLPSQALDNVRRVSAPATRPSEFGLSDTSKQHVGSLDGHYSGGHERQGVARTDATRLAQEAYREGNKIATLDKGFRTVWRMSKATRDAAGGEHYAIPIRATPDIPAPLRRILQRVEFRGLSAEEAAQLPPHELEPLREWLFPKTADPETNLSADGHAVRWVDRRMVDGLQKRQTRGAVIGHVKGKELTSGDLFDLINQPIRAGLLYTKPAYALNFLQALGTIALQQGVYTPANLTRAFRLGRELGWEDQHRVFAIVGEGATHALVDEHAHWLGEATRGAGHFWNAVVDRYPRVAAFLHEAQKAGYKSADEIHTLLHDEERRADLIEIADRANHEAIDYSMSQWERQNLRRFFFFYPWMRGATIWSLRFPLEHPLQSALYTPIAERAHGETSKALGELPSYTEGYNKLGGHVFNLGNLNTLQTLKDVVQGVGALAGNPGDPHLNELAGELGPVTGALYTLLSGKTSLGHDVTGSSRLRAAGGRLIEGQPLKVLTDRTLGKENKHTNAGKQSSTLHPHGTVSRLLDALERYTAGGLVPIKPNLPALHAKAEVEKVAEMGSRNALIYHYGQAYEQVDKEFPKVAKMLPAGFDQQQYQEQIKSAIDTQRQLQLHVRDYAHAHGVATSELTGEQRLGVVLAVLEQAGRIDHLIVQQEFTAMKQVPQGYRDDTARKQAEALAHGAGGGAVLAGWKALLEHVAHEKIAGVR